MRFKTNIHISHCITTTTYTTHSITAIKNRSLKPYITNYDRNTKKNTNTSTKILTTKLLL